MFIAETRLTSHDSSDCYKIEGFNIACRNDQKWNKESRPPHGIICYVKDSIRVLDVQKTSCETFEAILLCIQHTSLPIPVQLVGIYVSPHCKYSQVQHKFDDFMRDTDACTMIVVGDFNMKSITTLDEGYNRKLEQHLKTRFNLKQVILEETSNYASVLDLCFTNADVQTSVIWNFWSDHRILSVALM